ncbi:MAG TPA: hypothetical protein VFJ57_00085 [Solirubrobacterales bacterium]|nr:hypothetical protein [Solirubrobacterales bacterium]
MGGAGRGSPVYAVADQVRARLAKTSYSDVRVAVRGGGPCATLIDAEGAAVVVFTASRREDREQELGARAASALSPVKGETIDSCIAPARFEAAARAALSRAGLSQVRVHIYRPYEPCVGGGFGYDPARALVSFDADSRKLWKENSIGRKRAERARERYEKRSGSSE